MLILLCDLFRMLQNIFEYILCSLQHSLVYEYSGKNRTVLLYSLLLFSEQYSYSSKLKRVHYLQPLGYVLLSGGPPDPLRQRHLPRARARPLLAGQRH